MAVKTSASITLTRVNDGAAGVGIKSVDVEYYLSTSSTSQAGGSWTTTAPTWVDGKYIWTRTKTVTTDNKTTTTSPVCITGGKGSTGSVGQGVQSITEEYYLSTSKTTQTGGSWVTTPPTWSIGKYMWTRSKIVYKNPSSTSYTTPVCDSSWEAVNDIEIGGRNHIKNAALKYGTKNWTLTSGIATIDSNELHNGHKTFKIEKVGVTTNTWGGISQYDVITNPKQGDVYTLSYWYLVKDKSTFNDGFALELKGRTTSNTDTGIGYTTVTPSVIVEGEWTKISFQVTIYRTDLKSLFLYGWVRQSGQVWISEIKAEEGNKATAFTEAPEDVSQEIVDTVNEAKADIKVTTDAISSKVTSLQTTTTNIDGKVKDHESRIKTAESKITADAIINTVSSTVNAAKNEAINSANGSTDSKLKSYATQSSLTQTANSIIAKFTSTGGSNLLKNSDAKNGQYMWTGNGVNLTIGTSGASPFFGGNEFKSTFPNGLKYGESIKLKANTDYVYEGWIYCNASFKGSGVTPLHYWCMNTPNTSGQAQLEVLDYRQDVTKNVFNKCYIHFRTKSGDVYFTPFVYGGPEGEMVAVRQLSLTEGKVEAAWTPHPSEIYEGSTVIDGSGVTVNNGALRVKNKAGQTVLSGDSNGNLSLTGSIVVSSHNHQILRVDTADTKFPHMVIDSYGPYMDQLSVCSDYAGYVSQKAVNGVFIRNDRMDIYGVGQTFWVQGSARIGHMVTCDGSFQGRDFSLGETSGDRVLDSPWYGLGRSTNTSGGGRMVQLSGYFGLLFKTAGSTINIPHSGNISITGSDLITINNNNNWKGLDLYRHGCRARYGIGSDGTGGSQNFPAIECWNSGAGSYSSRLDVKSDVLQYYNSVGGTFKCWTNTGGHGGISIGNTGSGYLKWLRGHSDIQCRNYADNAYTRINASVFVVNSQEKAKENIVDLDSKKAINILMTNEIKVYNLINERNELEQVDEEAIEKGYILDLEMVEPDNHCGLILDRLTEEATDILQPGRTEGIDVYAMASILWKVCQEQQNNMLKFEERINTLESLLISRL